MFGNSRQWQYGKIASRATTTGLRYLCSGALCARLCHQALCGARFSTFNFPALIPRHGHARSGGCSECWVGLEHWRGCSGPSPCALNVAARRTGGALALAAVPSSAVCKAHRHRPDNRRWSSFRRLDRCCSVKAVSRNMRALLTTPILQASSVCSFSELCSVNRSLQKCVVHLLRGIEELYTCLRRAS